MKANGKTRIVIWLMSVFGLHTAWAQPASLTQIVLQATPTETLTVNTITASAGGPVRFDVTVSGVPAALPTGSINYSIAQAGTSTPQTSVVPLSGGSASWTTVAPGGSYIVSAAYSGDTNYRAVSSSSSGRGTPLSPDFGFAASTIYLKQGQSWTGPIQVIPVNGFAQTVAFSCSAPSGLTCSFPTKNYAAALPNVAGSATGIPLTITTYAGQFTSASLLLLPAAFGVRRRGKSKTLLLTALRGLGLLAICGCGASSNAGWQPITPKGTYQVAITGASGSIQHAGQITVIVE